MTRLLEAMATENYRSFEDQQQQDEEGRNSNASLGFADGFNTWSNSSHALRHALIHIIIYSA